MAYYRICPDCGATLDPREKCECQEETEKKREFFSQHLKMEPGSRQLTFMLYSGEVHCERKSRC